MSEAEPVTLVEFLRARLDEDEQEARALLGRSPHRWQRATDVGDWANYARVITGGPMVDSGLSQGEIIAECGQEEDWGRQTAEHIARHDPARALADVAAKRAIVDLYAEHAEYDNREDSFEHATGRIVGLGEAVRLLAEVHAQHPDYRPEWAPIREEFRP